MFLTIALAVLGWFFFGVYGCFAGLLLGLVAAVLKK